MARFISKKGFVFLRQIVKGIVLAMLLSGNLWAIEVQKTLATWNFTSNASDAPVQNATSMDSSIEGAYIALGSGVAAGTAGNSFGGKGFNGVASLGEAVDGGRYIELSLTVASGFSISLSGIDYSISRSSTGPTNLICVSQTAGGDLIELCEPYIYNGTSTKAFSHSFQSPLTVNGGSTVKFLIVGWGASKSSGTLYLKESITLNGAILTSGYVPPSVDVASMSRVELGTTLSIPITFSGDVGASVETNIVSTTSGVEGRYCLTNGIFSYTPAISDLSLSPIGFMVSLSVNGISASKSFDVAVWERPSFFETFERAGKTSYGADSIEGTAAAWYGTNYVAQGTVGDYYDDGRSVRFRGDSAYLEMTTDKNHGAGKISITQGIYKGDEGSGFLQLFLSNDGGKTWTAWQSELIAVTKEFNEVVFDDVNVEGRVRLRIVYSGEVRVNIDNVGITDYGEVITEPDEPLLAEIAVVNGTTVKEDFNAIGTGESVPLPQCWRLAYTNTLNCFDLDYVSAVTATEHNGGLGVKVTSAGLYNFGDGLRDEAEDRAIGFLSSGTGCRTSALMLPIRNVGTAPITTFRISYSIEKYRTGRSKKVELRFSRDGKEWLPISDSFYVETVADDSVASVDTLPRPLTVKAYAVINLPPNEVLYFGWFYYSNSDNSSNAQALAIDDIHIHAGLGTVLKLR